MYFFSFPVKCRPPPLVCFSLLLVVVFACFCSLLVCLCISAVFVFLYSATRAEDLHFLIPVTILLGISLNITFHASYAPSFAALYRLASCLDCTLCFPCDSVGFLTCLRRRDFELLFSTKITPHPRYCFGQVFWRPPLLHLPYVCTMLPLLFQI